MPQPFFFFFKRIVQLSRSLRHASAQPAVRTFSESEEKTFLPHAEAARRIICEEVDENPSIEQISICLGVSREPLSCLYKNETGRFSKDHIPE